ncbi:MAG TPA: type II toxin-antitoxin system RelE/ParE family toxin [Solirubrobacterales bacterium]|nr:type II toxin-antitoxin system RelE/ParE family toxin [Solirubrobacterales bacterium]
MSVSPSADLKVEALLHATADANQLEEVLRRQIARIVVDLHDNAYLGELMGDKPPRILRGCRKIRFDEPGWRGKPRYRLVYRNEPSDGAPAVAVILAIGRRDRMIAYAKAARRVKERAAKEGHSG